jgi:multidrug efflux pump subunit AcrA (membrane-fusion protein)
MRHGATEFLAMSAVLFVGTNFVALSGAAERSQEAEAPPVAQVVVVSVGNACFSAAIRVTGYLVARQEAIVPLSQGDKVVEVLVAEGDKVTADQTLARVNRQSVDTSKAGGGLTTDTVALKAPAAGIVIENTAFEGSTASPLLIEPLFKIAVDNEIELEAEVPSIYVPQLSAGQTARIQLFDTKEFSGRVRLVPASINQRTQLGRARITLERDPALRYGMFVSATINADRSCGISVPNSAVTYRTGGASVQVLHNNLIETRSIQVGIHSDSDIEVLKGLSEGDLVVANAGTSLRDGDRVKPIGADGAGGG